MRFPATLSLVRARSVNDAFLVWNTLYGMDLAGHTMDEDGKLWNMTLRGGLRLRDNQPVRARDVVASLIQARWHRARRRVPSGQQGCPGKLTHS